MANDQTSGERRGTVASAIERWLNKLREDNESESDDGILKRATSAWRSAADTSALLYELNRNVAALRRLLELEVERRPERATGGKRRR